MYQTMHLYFLFMVLGVREFNKVGVCSTDSEHWNFLQLQNTIEKAGKQSALGAKWIGVASLNVWKNTRCFFPKTKFKMRLVILQEYFQVIE